MRGIIRSDSTGARTVATGSWRVWNGTEQAKRLLAPDQFAGVVTAPLGLGEQAIAGRLVDLGVPRKQPEILAIRAADQRSAVALVQIEHPVVALGQTGKEPAEPVVEAHPQPIGNTGFLRHRFAFGFLQVAVFCFATVGPRHAAIGLQLVVRFGAYPISLKEPGQARQLIPGKRNNSE